jgi:hypothetical protein
MEIEEKDINAWKAKHRKVYEITVTDDEDSYKGYFCRPDMETLSVVNKLGKSDEVKAANVLFENCWLGGDPALKDEAILKMAAIARLNGLMNVRATEIKNL